MIRPAVPDDVDSIVRLLKVCMPQSTIPKTKDFWEWKHVRNPFGASPAVVAVSDGEIVGVRIFMRWTWKMGTDYFTSVRAVDTATHPEFQGRGIFSKLTTALLDQMKLEGISFVFNTPNKSSLPGYLKMGWRKVTRVPVWIRYLKPFRSIRNLAAGRSTVGASDDFNSVGKLFQEPELDSFLETLPLGNGYHTSRSRSYLKWRYEEIPGIRYRARWRFEKKGSAVLIFRERLRNRLQELSLSEILFSSNDSGLEMCSDLLKTLLRESKADYMIASAAPKSSHRSVLRGAGFLPFPLVGPILVARPIHEPDPRKSSLHWKNWACSLGDLEIF